MKPLSQGHTASQGQEPVLLTTHIYIKRIQDMYMGTYTYVLHDYIFQKQR